MAVSAPDNLEFGVKSAWFYDPGVKSTYLELATRYDTTVLPMRKSKQSAEAKIEAGVQQ